MRIPILYAGNAKVFDGMVISLLSVVKHTKEPLDVWLLTMDLRDVDPAFVPISDAQRAYLEDICKRANPESCVYLYDAERHYRETLLCAPNQDTQYTPYAFLRLYADRIPEIPDRVIYLDTDTVAMRSLRELYEIPLDGAEFAGVRDYYGCRFFGINYLNSGVLLLDLAKVRETGLFQKCLDLCGRKKVFLPDQTALNRLVKKKKVIPRRFNEQHKLRKDTVIRHFSMAITWWVPLRTRNIKPWNVKQVREVLRMSEIDDILDDYLSRKPNFPCGNP